MVKLTTKGEELLQKLQAGEIEKLTFTDMVLGCGSWSDGELAANIDTLKDIKLKQPVATKYAERKGDKTFIFLSTTFANIDVAETFYVHEVGLYALDGETEVLYACDITPAGTPAQAVVQDQSVPQYIPVSLDIGVSNIDAVNLTLTADLSVISAEQFRSHTEDFNNPHKVTKTNVGLGNCDNTADIDKSISTATLNALNLKQPTGDYATNTALNNGLAGKAATSHNHAGYQPAGDYATNTALNNGLAGKAANGHGHDYNSLSGKPAILAMPNSSNFIHLFAMPNSRLRIPNGGTWVYSGYCHLGSGAVSGGYSGVVPGDTEIFAAHVGETKHAFAWRIS